MIFKRKRTESDNSLVSEGLREAITSYLQMTEGHDHSWDTWAETVDQSESEVRRLECSHIPSCLICCVGKPLEEVTCTPNRSLCCLPWSAGTRMAEPSWDTTMFGAEPHKTGVCVQRGKQNWCELETECQRDICANLNCKIECFS